MGFGVIVPKRMVAGLFAPVIDLKSTPNTNDLGEKLRANLTDNPFDAITDFEPYGLGAETISIHVYHNVINVFLDFTKGGGVNVVWGVPMAI
jgi:hypothetical protein